MKLLTIIVVDDHKIFREGIELIISQLDFVGKVVLASNGIEYLDIVDKINPDIVIMDINMPKMDGIEATKISKKKYPEIKIIALSMHTNFEYYTSMTNVGVDGFLTKDTDRAELKTAIVNVFNNEGFFSQKLLQQVMDGISKKNTERSNAFSKREIEVLQLIAKGLSIKDVSENLFISPKVVEQHKEDMLKKTDCHNTICLIIYSIKANIIKV